MSRCFFDCCRFAKERRGGSVAGWLSTSQCLPYSSLLVALASVRTIRPVVPNCIVPVRRAGAWSCSSACNNALECCFSCTGCVLMKEILPGSVKLADEPGKDFCCKSTSVSDTMHTSTTI